MVFSKIFSLSKGTTFHTNRTICELNRELFDICVLKLHEEKPELLGKVVRIMEKAFIHGVKMNRRLVRYKLGTSSKWEKKEYRKPEINRKRLKEMRKERVRLENLLMENERLLSKVRKKKK